MNTIELSSTRETIHESRDVPVVENVDVAVVGGGPAGVCATVAASRLGMKTALIEQYGFPGGMWTAGHVTTLCGYNSVIKPYTRCAGGIAGEWLHKAAAIGFAEDNNSATLNSDPEGMKLVADRMLKDTGAMCLFHTYFSMPILDHNRIIGILVENLDGRSAILSKVTVDCTGNGDVIARTGAKWTKGNKLQPLTMCFSVANVNPTRNISHSKPQIFEIDPQSRIVEGHLNKGRRSDIEVDREAMIEAFNQGKLPPFGGPYLAGLYKDMVHINATRIVAD